MSNEQRYKMALEAIAALSVYPYQAFVTSAQQIVKVALGEKDAV